MCVCYLRCGKAKICTLFELRKWKAFHASHSIWIPCCKRNTHLIAFGKSRPCRTDTEFIYGRVWVYGAKINIKVFPRISPTNHEFHELNFNYTWTERSSNINVYGWILSVSVCVRMYSIECTINYLPDALKSLFHFIKFNNQTEAI